VPIVPKPLLDDIAEGRCLPFIGAGFSANAHLPGGERIPTWSGLTASLAEAGSIASGEGPDVAEEYERLYGRVGLVDAIRRALRSDIVRPGRAHKAFARLPFDTVYTTNFDLLLEDACLEVRRPFRSLVGELQLPFHAGPIATNIVKMHGDLRHEEHVVVTRRDYGGFLSKYPVVATHLSAMLITRTALFIGYSRSDPDFQQVAEVVRSRLGRFRRMSYMIQFDAASDDMAAALDDQMHVISLDTAETGDRSSALAEFFIQIQTTIDKRAGANLRARHPEAFEADVPYGAVTSVLDQPSGVRVLEGTSHMCFVTMPFSPELDRVYYDAVAPAIEETGLTAVRVDQIVGSRIGEQIRAAIQNARLCIADISGTEVNIMYEVGIAQSMGKPLILIAQDAASIPIEVSSRVILYQLDDIERLAQTLRPALAAILQEGKFEEAEHLISIGTYAAAVSVLSVQLEQLLRRRVMDAFPKPKRGRIRMSGLGHLVGKLGEAGGLDDLSLERLRTAVEIRNATVHGVREPSREDAELMREVVRIEMGRSSSY